MKLRLGIEEANYGPSSRRGQQASAAIYYIDGVPVRIDAVISELGVDKRRAIEIIRSERRAGRVPLTWPALKARVK